LFVLLLRRITVTTNTATERVRNRWLVVLGAVVIQLCLGALYAWSVFTPYLVEGPFNFTKTQTQVIFSVSLASFAITMILAGRWQAKSGPRVVALTGGLVMGGGFILAGLLGGSPFGHFVNQIIFIGLVAGIGIGLAYVCPIAVGMRWFPDKKGMITGLAVAGFGFGALIWIQLAGEFGGLIESLGVSGVFTLYGIIFAVAITIGSLWMVNPPHGWCPAGWTPPVPGAGRSGATSAMRAGEMLRTPQFYGLWGMFIFCAMAGLLVIGNIKLFGIEALQTGGRTAEQASVVAGIAMAVFYSLANGGGRIAWGMISDRIGRKPSLIIMCATQGIIMILFYWMGRTPALLYLGATIIGFNYGGAFSLFPTMTGDLFGTEHVGENYGWVFTAYGVGGIIGPIMAASIRDVWQNWMAGFVISGVACLIAAVIGWRLQQPRVEAEVARGSQGVLSTGA
jgi:MFS transporter, OFA family, oxalate/formate antiporter